MVRTANNHRYNVGQQGILAGCCRFAGSEVVIKERVAGAEQPGYIVNIKRTSQQMWVRESELLNVR